MSQYPGPPPPYYGLSGNPPTNWNPAQWNPHPPSTEGGHPPAPPFGPGPGQPYPGYFVPGVIMPMAPVVPPSDPGYQGNPTYITNYIYHGTTVADSSSAQPPFNSMPQIAANSNQAPFNPPQIAELSGDFDWVPSTAMTAVNLTGKAVVGGHEGWDGSPLWVIRAWHNGDLIPGKFSVRHNSASIVYDNKEVHVQNIEVLVAKPESLQWIPASNGGAPPGAISGGKTTNGENLYVGRARYQLSITPGKVCASHQCCYIPFQGQEVAVNMYDVLCRV